MEWTLRERIDALKSEPELLANWKAILHKSLQTVEYAGNYEDVLGALPRLVIEFIDGLTINDTSKKKKDARAKFKPYVQYAKVHHGLPSEIASLLDNVLSISAKERHGEAAVRLGNRDARLALDTLLRVLEWFFTECPTGPRLESIDDLPEHPQASRRALGHPPAVGGFVGRNNELEKLRQMITDKKTMVISIGGPAGQGKTYLAARSCKDLVSDNRDIYFSPLWVRCDENKNINDLVNDFEMESGQRDAYPSRSRPNESYEKRLETLVDRLNKDEYVWLLVLDDFHEVESDQDWMQLVETFAKQSRKSKLLLTTRQEPEAIWDPKLPPGAHGEIRLQPVAGAESQEFMAKLGLDLDESMAERVWKKCSGVPLAMNLFAQAERRRPLEELLALDLPEWSVASSAWFDEFLKMPQLEIEAAKRLSVFDEPIEPFCLLEIGVTQKGLKGLEDRYLVTRTEDRKQIQFHALLRDYWRKKIGDDESNEWKSKVGELLWEKAEKILLKESWIETDSDEYIKLTVRSHDLVERSGDQQRANDIYMDFMNQWLDRVVQASDDLVSAGDIQQATDMMFLDVPFATIDYDSEDFACVPHALRGVGEMHESAGKKFRKHLGLSRTLRYQEASRRYQQALEKFKFIESAWDGHEWTADMHACLARNAEKREDYAEAERWLVEGLNWCKVAVKREEEEEKLPWDTRVWCPKDKMVSFLRLLGDIAKKQGEEQTAERRHKESLDLSNTVLDEQRRMLPFINVVLENEPEPIEVLRGPFYFGQLNKGRALQALAFLYHKQGRMDEARQCCKEALGGFARCRNGDQFFEEVEKLLEILDEESPDSMT